MHLKRLAWLVPVQVTPQSILDGAVEAPEPMRELYAAIDKVSSWAIVPAILQLVLTDLAWRTYCCMDCFQHRAPGLQPVYPAIPW